MPDPKLTVAMEEVTAVLKKHDLGAIVFLASPTHTEYLMRFDPTWSCCFFEEGDERGSLLRFRSMLADYKSKADQKQQVEDTTGMLCGFHIAMRQQIQNLGAVIGLLDRHYNITHTSTEE